MAVPPGFFMRARHALYPASGGSVAIGPFGHHLTPFPADTYARSVTPEAPMGGPRPPTFPPWIFSQKPHLPPSGWA